MRIFKRLNDWNIGYLYVQFTVFGVRAKQTHRMSSRAAQIVQTEGETVVQKEKQKAEEEKRQRERCVRGRNS